MLCCMIQCWFARRRPPASHSPTEQGADMHAPWQGRGVACTMQYTLGRGGGEDSCPCHWVKRWARAAATQVPARPLPSGWRHVTTCRTTTRVTEQSSAQLAQKHWVCCVRRAWLSPACAASCWTLTWPTPPCCPATAPAQVGGHRLPAPRCLQCHRRVHAPCPALP